MDLVTLSSCHLETELSIGAAHGIGKVSTSLPPEDVRNALQVSPPRAESSPPTVAIISQLVLRHSGQLRFCTNSQSI